MNAISRLRRALGAFGLAAALILPGTAMAAEQIGASSSPLKSSTGDIPNTVGDAVRYHYFVRDGGSVTDSIPVQICLETGDTNASWQSFQVQFLASGGAMPGVTTPSNLMFEPPAAFPLCKTATINIATGPLNLDAAHAAGQEFGANIRVDAVSPMPSTGESKPQVNWTGIRVIQLRIQLKPADGNASCFITDSSGSFLTKCDGSLADQSESDEGRFAIVASRKNIEVATNPGQFYYNVLYHNPASEAVTVDVAFSRNGVSPKGTQAIHAALFAPPFSGYTQEGFDTVNESIPEGADDEVLGITIPAGWTLWVDYHLDWNGLGSAVPPGCATDCVTANQTFSVTGTVTPSSGSPESCSAGAWGYKK